jgi:hypothetical protein
MKYLAIIINSGFQNPAHVYFQRQTDDLESLLEASEFELARLHCNDLDDNLKDDIRRNLHTDRHGWEGRYWTGSIDYYIINMEIGVDNILSSEELLRKTSNIEPIIRKAQRSIKIEELLNE